MTVAGSMKRKPPPNCEFHGISCRQNVKQAGWNMRAFGGGCSIQCRRSTNYMQRTLGAAPLSPPVAGTAT